MHLHFVSLDQAFNSLEAEREACAAYIKSQAGEGWRPVKAHYDDGGISGGTMERPALQQLLADIEAGRVNVVVVYKVDRLTRSLSDFAKIVKIFDEGGVSFVSITQQFNTTTSMGRLTLNMLLSFAQFEREVTGERIRDKIGASKRKGMWMGGVVPLGFDAVERKLVINKAEAETVRTLFRLYLKLGNVRRVQREADRLGLRTKARKPNNGRRPGGAPFTRGHIYKLLANPIYVGDIVHKGERFGGEHEAIIDHEVWDAAQQQLRCNAVTRRHGTNTKTRALLAGLLVDANGHKMVPTHANKAGRRYRYYISKPVKETSADTDAGWRLPAPAIEDIVITEICRLLCDRSRLIEALCLTRTPPDHLGAILSRFSSLGDRLCAAGPADQQDLLREVIDQVVVRHVSICISIRSKTLRMVIGADESDKGQECRTKQNENDVTLELPVRFKRRGVEMKLILTNEQEPKPKPDPILIKAVAEGHGWFEELRSATIPSVGDLAERHGIDQGDVSRRLPLAFLAPDIVEAILEGRQPIELTAARMMRIRDLPLSWAKQRQRLGFAD
jgi:DNA invertase Pin-like site-specific DNA recombinase